MKKIMLALVLIAATSFTACSSSKNISNDDPGYNYNEDYNVPGNYQQYPVTYQQFYDGLSPYGRWINYPGYGYVWSPNIQSFRPYYSDGYWTYTDYGWTWVSNYDWGWAPFHYGRWTYDDFYGWIWVPGYEWAPAWVAWGNNTDYYGWAPLGPEMNINSSFNSIPYNNWAFVPHRCITYRNINNYYVPQQQNTVIIKTVAPISNYSVKNRIKYALGPTAMDVQQRTNTKVTKVTIREADKPAATQVNDKEVVMYKPAVVHNTTATEKPKPANFVEYKKEQNVVKAEKKENTAIKQNEEIKKPQAPVERRENVFDKRDQKAEQNKQEVQQPGQPVQPRVVRPVEKDRNVQPKQIENNPTQPRPSNRQNRPQMEQPTPMPVQRDVQPQQQNRPVQRNYQPQQRTEPRQQNNFERRNDPAPQTQGNGRRDRKG